MSEASVPLMTERGYQPPRVTQFSVFLDNKVGKLHELLSKFDLSTVKICALSVNDASDHAVVRVITNDSKATKCMLRESGLAHAESQLLVVEIPQGHSLERMCLYLVGAELNIRFAYPLMLKPNGAPTIALAVDELELAGQILRRKEFRLLAECDLTECD